MLLGKYSVFSYLFIKTINESCLDSTNLQFCILGSTLLILGGVQLPSFKVVRYQAEVEGFQLSIKWSTGSTVW